MQIKTGKASATNGSDLITSSSDANWNQVVAGCMFFVQGSASFYYVENDAVFDPTANSNQGGWYFYVNRPFREATITDQDYTIVRDFTSAYNIPMLSSGDVETATVFTRAMQVIDAAILAASQTGAGGGPQTYTKSGHNFVIGSCLRVDGSGVFQLAASDTDANSRIVGLVSSVNGDDFTLVTNGMLTGLSGLSVGDTYYLKNVANPVNYTNSLLDVTIRLPIWIALSSSTAMLLPVAPPNREMTGASGVADGSAGAVPKPIAGENVKFLRGDATFADALPPDHGLQFKHLDQTNPFTASDWSAIADTDSIYNALVNLHTRLANVEAGGMNLNNGINNYTTAGSFVWTCPVGITQARVSLIGGGGSGGSGGYSGLYKAGGGGGAGEFAEALITVTPGQDYLIVVGSGGTVAQRRYSGTFHTDGEWVGVDGGVSSFGDPQDTKYLSALGGKQGVSAWTGYAGGVGGTGGTTGSDATIIARIAGGDGGNAQIPPTKTQYLWAGKGGSCSRGGAGGIDPDMITNAWTHPPYNGLPTMTVGLGEISGHRGNWGHSPGGGGEGGHGNTAINNPHESAQPGNGGDGQVIVRW